MPPGLADDTPRICEHTEGLKRLRCPRKDGPAGGQGAADEGLRRGCLRDLRDSCQRARRDPNLRTLDSWSGALSGRGTSTPERARYGQDG